MDSSRRVFYILSTHLAEGMIRSRRFRLGVDVGGTFTDVSLVDSGSGRSLIHKAPTNRRDLVSSVTRAVREALQETGVSPLQLVHLSMGSTIALNTIIERSAGPTGLLVTRGFRDVLEIRRIRLPDAPSFLAARPVPLVPRRLVREVDQRIDSSGRDLRSLQVDQVLYEVEELVQAGIESLAICFLHSYVNPSHERGAAEIISSKWPALFVCASSDIWPQQREYERALSTVMNAYIGPRMRSYYDSIVRELTTLGVRCPMFATQSNGGVMALSEAANVPVRTLLSGPASGVMGATRASREAGLGQIFTFDMGGTSADMAVVDGSPRFSTDSTVGEYTLFMPAVSIDSIGAGGGSIAWIDDQGILKVGPRSAGATPGPACYGRGGSDPTVTDAYLVAGIIGENDLLGGAMQVSRSLAEQALSRLGQGLGLSAPEVADAILRITTGSMFAEFLPLVARFGIDQRDFTLVAYGGAGPTHAFLLAEEAGVQNVLIPRSPGAMCAIGAAQTDLQMDFVRSGRWTANDALPAPLERTFAELEKQARSWVESQGIGWDSAEVSRSADMRYEGQSYEVTVQLSPEATPSEAFDALYQQIYGYRDAGRATEVIQARVLVRVPVASEVPPEERSDFSGESVLPRLHRSVRHQGTWIEAAVVPRDLLFPGTRHNGPLVVTQYDTTTFVVPGFSVFVDEWGNLRGERSHV